MLARRVSCLVIVPFMLCVSIIAAISDPGGSAGILVAPEIVLPIGDKASNYRLAVGGRIEGLLGLARASFLTPSLELAYTHVPLEVGQEPLVGAASLMILRAGLAARASIPIGERFSLFARGHAGGFFAHLDADLAGNAPGLSLGVGGGLAIVISSRMLAEIGASYDTCLALHDGVSLFAGVTAGLSGPGNSAIPRKETVRTGPGSTPLDGYIEFSSVEIERIFPVLYKYYDDHPIGHATVTNARSRVVEDVEVRLSLSQFMDVPKLSARIERLRPGEQQEIDIYVLLTEQVLSITEGAKIGAELTATYSASGRAGQDTEVVTLDTYDRNALRWDDDQKIAAFVTAKDQEIQRYARNIASIVDDEGIEAIDRSLQLGMLLLSSMKENRCTYVPDPSSPYAELSQDTEAVDSVQFPRQTLEYRAGDCDDLAATYAALLESVGVSTAFITVPGHIYAAFTLDMSRDEARQLTRTQEIIFQADDSVWVPVETTLLGEGFLAAWTEGARQWREHSDYGTAELIRTSDAWREYEPVAFGVSEYELEIPLRVNVANLFRDELNAYVSQEIADQEAEMRSRLRGRPSDVSIHNRLGVVYARYGRYEDAEEQFRAALDLTTYLPALINLGNVGLLRDAIPEAKALFLQALEEDPENSAAMLGLARVEYRLQNYAAAETAHGRLTEVAPEIAERFAYLGGAVQSGDRASDALRTRGIMVWEEER